VIVLSVVSSQPLARASARKRAYAADETRRETSTQRHERAGRAGRPQLCAREEVIPQRLRGVAGSWRMSETRMTLRGACGSTGPAPPGGAVPPLLRYGYSGWSGTMASRGQDLLPFRPHHPGSRRCRRGSSTRCRLNAETAFSGISRSICPPMLATRVRRSVSWWSSCRLRRVDSRASKIHLSWPRYRVIRGAPPGAAQRAGGRASSMH
jgi:hypothetical protein